MTGYLSTPKSKTAPDVEFVVARSLSVTPRSAPSGLIRWIATTPNIFEEIDETEDARENVLG